MRTRTFSDEEKEQIRLQMLHAGLPLLREKGMIHMSITTLTETVGIGKSTFYSFYKSKEEFVEDMLKFQRKGILERLKCGLKGNEKYSREDSIEIIRNMITNANNAFSNFSMEDELALQKLHEKNETSYLNLEHEIKMIDSCASLMEGVKDNLDYAVISNIMKIIVFTSEQKTMLHEDGYKRTIHMLIDLLLQNIFEEQDGGGSL